MLSFVLLLPFQLKSVFKLLLSSVLITIQIMPCTIQAVLAKECPQNFSLFQQEAMIYHLDILQNPCDDFYEYACGNWRVKYPLRMLEATDTLTAIKATNRQMLIEYLEKNDYTLNENDFNGVTTTFKPAASTTMSESQLRHQLVIDLYKSCMDRNAWKSKTENERILQYYINVLKNFTPTWPILQNDYTTTMNHTINWEYLAGEMRKYGVQAFFRLQIQTNWQMAQQLIFYIVPPTFEWLKRQRTDTTYDDDTVFLYQRYIKSLLMDLKVRVRKANQLAIEIIEFEKQLLNLIPNEHSMVLREPITLKSLFQQMPQINFENYFTTLLKDYELPEQWPDIIMIASDNLYLERLAEFLHQTKPEIILKYLLIQFLIHFEINLHDDESYTKQKIACLQLINDFLPDHLTDLYIELLPQTSNDFLKESHSHLVGIFTKLKQQFGKMLNNSIVFEKDPATKLLTLNKLNSMQLLIPQMVVTTEGAATHHQYRDNINISLSSTNYDLNIINLWQLRTEREFNPLISQLTQNESTLQTIKSHDITKTYGPLDVNAYYRLKKNAIELPIGLLRTPLYHPCLKPAQLYGGFVYIIAHELIHGFDYDGLNYDSMGTMDANHTSWGVKALIKFGVRSNCYLNARYKNGPINLNENIADTEGLRLALETFLEQEMSDTFDMDDLKLFFTSFAQTWCGNNYRVTSTNNPIKLLHADHKERVNNVLGNFMEFSDIFKCKPGVVMHPEEKCRIW